MGNRVVILDEMTVNQIAAGEVVERPASVVKELVENSIDAGSTVIQIELEEAGLKQIRVTDNGSGMSAEDAQLALARHATSKIRAAADLLQVGTLGFRGEALPSIAAVSRLELTTRTPEMATAVRLIVEGGTICRIDEEGSAVGTQVVVSDLFYNTPARRKFLKSASTELGYIIDLVERLMLGHPAIAFQIKHQGRVILQSRGNNNLLEVISGIYGRETARAMMPVQLRQENLTIEGFVSQPSLTRSSRRWQTIFVNGRCINSRLISEAISEAYQTRLPVGRYPLVVLRLNIPPNQVDVNVHPTKMEVRFQHESQIQQLVVEGVSQALQAHQSAADFWANYSTETHLPTEEAKQTSLNTKNRDVRTAPVVELFSHARQQLITDEIIPAREDGQITGITSAFRIKDSSPWQVAEPTVTSINVPEADAREPKPDAPTRFCELIPLGQLKATYIIAIDSTGLYIIDQHAAHERVRYEQLQTVAQGAPSSSQGLLFPVTLELAGEDREVLLRHIIRLRDLGFIVEHFGGNTFLLREVPMFLEGDARSYFLDLLELLREAQWKVERQRLWDEALKLAACKSAIKAGDLMTRPEMERLLEELDRVNQPYTCPHGRPTVFRLSLGELEKRFLRA
ncbi:MAG: DNA mismatch repair endonuclease MutL [Firmicutes bacterium]|nr:DNA mismatch repair endonuclease MutL [Bacillota bacterium]